jgi:hypothetical protein
MKKILATLTVFAMLLTVSHAWEQARQDDRPPYYLTDAELDKKLDISEKTDAPKEYVWLIYFHRVPGCATCQLMSKYIYETVEKRFGDDVKGKQIVLRFRNLDEQKNANLVRRFNIRSPMLVVVHIKDGKLVKAKHADKIWSLAAEKDKFLDYVEKEIKSYKTENVEGERR